MKKALIFLTSLLTLLVSFAHPSDAPLAALAAEETTGENIYASSFLDFDRTTAQRPSFYSSSENETISEDAKKLNEAMTTYIPPRLLLFGYSRPGLFVNNTQDVLSGITNQLIDANLNPDYVVNSSNTTTFLKMKAANEDEDGYYMGLYYKIAKPIIYFDSTYKDDISFYIRSYNSDYIKDLATQYGVTGELTFLQIDDNPIITLRFLENDFELIAHNGSTIEPAVIRYRLNTSQTGYGPFLKITIPNRDSIRQVALLEDEVLLTEEKCESFNPIDSPLVFGLHSDVNDYSYFYNFDIKSLSVINRTLSVDENSYTRITLPDEEVDESATISAQLTSMTLLFTGALRSTTMSVGAIKSTQLGLGQTVTIYSIPKTQTFECTFTGKSETSNTWSYTCEDLPTTASGQMTIQSISFHPVIDGTVREDVTFTQDFSKTNLYKYSFDVEKSARIYYYQWKGYYKQFNKNNIFSGAFPDSNIFNEMASSLLGSVLNYKYNYHCFGFSFYFDDDKTESIPNVQKIRLKWQCGYKEANPDPDSGGFYKDTSDTAKKIHIEEKTINDNRLANGTYALDKDGMFLADKDSCNKAFTQNGRFDYVVAKFRQRGDKTFNTYISAMAPLEIFYETITGEVVRMIGNSKGLHVVTDELGNSIVVNSEGVAPDDEIYGIYEAEDGTKYPGIDKNGDGKITADEVINSDTGEGANYADPNDQSFLNKVEDFFKDLLAQIKDAVKKPRTWLWTILIILVVGTIVLAILKPSTLISIFNSIKKSIQSLFSKLKNKKAKKKTSSSKKVKKKSNKSKRKKK